MTTKYHEITLGLSLLPVRRAEVGRDKWFAAEDICRLFTGTTVDGLIKHVVRPSDVQTLLMPGRQDDHPWCEITVFGYGALRSIVGTICWELQS